MTLADHMQRAMIRIYLRYVSVLFCALAWVAVKLSRRRGPPGRELLILKPDAIGDYLLFRNLLALIRESERFRDYRITYCGNAVCRDIAERYDRNAVDEFIWIDKPMLYLNPFRYARLVARMSGRYAVTLHAVRSRELLFDFLAFHSSPGERVAPAGDAVNILPFYKKLTDRWYTRRIGDGEPWSFEFEANQRFIAELLGLSPALSAPSLEQLPGATGDLPDLPAQFAVVFPGAQLPFRRWDPARFAAVCRHLREKHGCGIVLMGGPKDRKMTRRIAECLPFPVTDLSGRTRLTQLPGIIARARVLLANDSMAVHLAATQGVPSVVISQMNHYLRFVPYPHRTGIPMLCVIPLPYLNEDPLVLARRFRNGSWVDIGLVTVEQVQSAIDQVLAACEPKQEER